MELEGRFFRMIRELTARMHAVRSERLKEIGLTLPQMLVMIQVYQEPKTIGGIVEAVQLSYSTVSGIVDRLERDGWVERVGDLQDRRVIWIHKTKRLEEAKERYKLFEEHAYGELLSGLTPEELDMVSESVNLILNQMEKKVEEKKA
ncbi:putative transcriptional regulator [Paenibacillus mucilaginosus 3016]|uniref:Transcriptional regulator n=2 Tax=Paenibacillus mucilaginosus TaxID=61624 RepID=I0BUV6_9BACL|nr:MarR family transcriptional regulator [Paenibacillus mucilaginosus]AFC33827.1 putative transcriptional regulator [Paenibacillus mucilaginosus 3016]AFH66153.1 transcriptional regulator [Paenibacillus mucilaginosus K02]WFA22214.1 MarR family transcriptional regulator [Paenibacillus mucilaginosus]